MPIDFAARIGTVQQQIKRLEQYAKQTEERKIQLEQEAVKKRQELESLEQQEEHAHSNYMQLFKTMTEKKNIGLPQLERKASANYRAMTDARDKEEDAHRKMNELTREEERIDRLVDNAQQERDEVQCKYNIAVNKPYSRTAEQMANGTLSPEEMEVKKYREDLERLQQRVDQLVKQQDEIYEKKFNAQVNLFDAQSRYSSARTDYQEAEQAVNKCKAEIEELQHACNKAQSQMDNLRVQRMECEARVNVLEGNYIPAAEQQAMEAQNNLLMTKPKLEEIIQNLTAAAQAVATTSQQPDRGQYPWDAMPPGLQPQPYHKP